MAVVAAPESNGTARCSLAGSRIIIVLDSLELGGAERQAIRLAKFLQDEERSDVEVWGFGAPGLAAEFCESLGVRWRAASLNWGTRRLSKWPRAILNLAGTLRQARPDVLLPFTMLPNLLCGLTWRLSGAATCIWNQRDAGVRLPRYDARLERLAVWNTPLFASNSRIGIDFLTRVLGVNPTNVFLIRNGVELDAPAWDRGAWRARLEIDERAFVACMVANLHVLKDHATLLRAWRMVVDQLAARGRECVLLLAGRLDSGAADAKALAFDLELGRTVRFLGPVKDISGLLSAVDLGVLSTGEQEGCPNGVLECMACGLPVVGTDIPGIREAVGPDGEELLTELGDHESLAARILALALDPERRRSRGSANFRRVTQWFSSEQMGRSMSDVIQSALRP